MACTPLLEYSRPVYITGQAPPALAMRRARSRMVSAGTPVMRAATSGEKCWTYPFNSSNPWHHSWAKVSS
jgi:hypothetical protein